MLPSTLKTWATQVIEGTIWRRNWQKVAREALAVLTSSRDSSVSSASYNYSKVCNWMTQRRGRIGMQIRRHTGRNKGKLFIAGHDVQIGQTSFPATSPDHQSKSAFALLIHSWLSCHWGDLWAEKSVILRGKSRQTHIHTQASCNLLPVCH